jgi:RimJ/RimL family protein N-acetyltransferase
MWHGPAVAEVLAGLTPAEAAARPIPGAHGAWELVLHMAAWAEIAAARLDGGRVAYPPPDVDWPAPPAHASAEAWAAAQARLAAAYEALAARVLALPDARLVEPVSGQEHSVGAMLDGVVEHGTYHGGQLALLKRAGGAPRPPGDAFLETDRLVLVLESTEAVLARIAALPPADRAEVSPAWLAQLRAAPAPTPWTHGVALVERAAGAVVGSAGFKGPPDADGVAEVAYGLAPAYRGRGYAREAARALSEWALGAGGARGVRAHTRPDNAASARVLAACGFVLTGEVHDPEDGLVQRWERRAPADGPTQPPPDAG